MLIRGYYLVIIIQQCNCFRAVIYLFNVCKRYLPAKINLIFVQRAKYMVESLTTLHNIPIVLQFQILLFFIFFTFFFRTKQLLSPKRLCFVSRIFQIGQPHPKKFSGTVASREFVRPIVNLCREVRPMSTSMIKV